MKSVDGRGEDDEDGEEMIDWNMHDVEEQEFQTV